MLTLPVRLFVQVLPPSAAAVAPGGKEDSGRYGMSTTDGAKDFTIRSATPADVPTILGFIRELAEYERMTHEVVATEAIIAESLFGPRPAAEAIIADVDGKAVGYACYFTSFSSFLGRGGVYIEDIYVQPHIRGCGIGKQLMTRIAQTAVERRCGRLEWAVLNWNEPSIAFYKSLGARAMAEWTVYRVTGVELQTLAAGGSPEP
jgi:GNAT superfamily N-acetyltransferase